MLLFYTFLSIIPLLQGVLLDSKVPPKLYKDVKSVFKVPQSLKTFKFTCPLVNTDDRSVIIQWIKDEEVIEPSYNHRFKTARNGKDLKIKDIEPSDSGHYQCVAINGFGNARNNFTLIVFDDEDEYLPRDESLILSIDEQEPSWTYPNYIRTSTVDFITPKVNGDLQLNCASKGNPLPEINWYKNGQKIDLDHAHQSILSAKFVLHNVQKSDSGIYSCTVFNKYGQINATFRVVVGKSSNDFSRDFEFNIIDNEKIISGARNNFGTHVEVPSNKSVTIGSIAEFECKIKWSEAMPLIKWFKKVDKNKINEKDINSVININGIDLILVDNYGEENILTQNGQKMFIKKLTIKDVSLDDEGTYVCVVSNGGDIVERSATLNVYSEKKTSMIEDNLMTYFKYGCAIFLIFVILCIGAIVYLYKNTTDNKDEERLTVSPLLIAPVIRPPPPKMPPPKTPIYTNNGKFINGTLNTCTTNTYSPMVYDIPWENSCNAAVLKQLSPGNAPIPIHRTTAEDTISHIYDETSSQMGNGAYWSKTLPYKYKNIMQNHV
uniref:receptor protein-tyrosine kinase n=1 Tax=Strongyloides stercoralis TaxID=6248 RepID=A0A0K0EB30_STRER